MDLYQQYIHKSRYARWDYDKKRRENWDETVMRYVNFMENHLKENCNYILEDDLKKKMFQYIYEQKVMPSMRALMTAGKALERDPLAGYNCSFIIIDNQRAFDEALFILACGVGLGYSVERQFIGKLPEIEDEFYETDTTIIVPDSKLGWAKSFKELIAMLYSGQIPKFDLSKIREKGSPLKVFGGRASGKEPLELLFNKTIEIFKKAKGRKLNSSECSDIMCHIATTIVCGSVRRSALICLSNLSDERMRNYKNGQWWVEHPERSMVNVSVAYTEKPDMLMFMKEWQTLYESKSGERGIFNRVAVKKQIETNSNNRDSNFDFGINPCGEVVLRGNSKQGGGGLCNLSEVICRENDTIDDLKQKVEIATILGTFQSTLTDFRYIRKGWKFNAEDERLLGVSLTGIMDCNILNKLDDNVKHILSDLRDISIEINKKWSKILNINQSKSIGVLKPSGSVSQLNNTSSGLHSRFSQYYLRAVRNDSKDPLSKFMKEKGFYCEQDVMNPTNDVFYFPIKSPEGCVLAKDETAIEQLEKYLLFKNYWCQHNPSITVYVREDEWLEVGAWVYKHFDDIIGVTFLPYSDHIYKQAPYTEITKEEYDEWVKKTPKEINWDELSKYEEKDYTTSSQELSCFGGACELNL